MKLASIEKISEVIPHPNADRLRIFKLEGMAWRVVSAENYQVGDLVGYAFIDTIAPEIPEFEFLRDKKFRIKQIKLRGEISCGLIFPLENFKEQIGEVYQGKDIGEAIGFQKFTKPEPVQTGDSDGSFPTYLIPKTDEDNLLSNSDLINEFIDRQVCISQKIDGSSSSIINSEEEGFIVCSRNLKIKDNKDSKYWIPVYKYNLKEKLPKDYALQAECYGNGVQGNPLSINGVDMAVFNVWDLKNRKLLNYQDTIDFCDKLKIPMVETVYAGEFYWQNVDELVEFAKTIKYPNNKPAEGIVVRLQNHEWNDKLQKMLSVKVINPLHKD